MARKRLIAPEFFTHGELYDAEVQSGLPLRVAFPGLWTQCDRRGYFRWRPRELKLAVLPYDNVDFEAVLTTLAAHGFIVRYVVDGKEYGRIPSFAQWQSFHPHEKGAADIPEPPTVVAATVIGGAKPTDVGPEPTNERPEPDNDGPSRAAVITAVTPITAVTTANGSVSKRKNPGAGAPDPKPREFSPEESDVFEHYLAKHPKRRCDRAKARRLIGAALKTFKPDELKQAIDGNAGDPWHVQRQKHELSYVLHDEERISSFVAMEAAKHMLIGAGGNEGEIATWIAEHPLARVAR